MAEFDVHVAIQDPAAAYRRGLGAALRAAGFSVQEPKDPDGIAPANGVGAVLLTVRSASDWETVRALKEVEPPSTVVVLLVDPSSDRHAEALRAGADSVVAWDADPDQIVGALRAALEGCTLLPTHIARAIACTGLPVHDPGWISPEEVKWLKLLAQGVPIQQVAQQVGYSERAFYRLLHGLYGRMRVSNRTEAILQACRWGLL